MIPNGRTILLVDDSEDDIELMRRAFAQKKLPYELAVVRDGQQALDYLRAPDIHTVPTLILLDLNLPKLSGLETLRRIRGIETTQLVPVVVLTTSKEENDIVASYRNGANSYVCKPVDFNKFISAIEIICLYWLSINESIV